MKKLLLLVIFVVFLVFVLINRNRLYVRDPLGSVARDGVKEAGAQVYINFQNAVLIENENDAGVCDGGAGADAAGGGDAR